MANRFQLYIPTPTYSLLIHLLLFEALPFPPNCLYQHDEPHGPDLHWLPQTPVPLIQQPLRHVQRAVHHHDNVTLDVLHRVHPQHGHTVHDGVEHDHQHFTLYHSQHWNRLLLRWQDFTLGI
jgi:hypothetical protein